MVIRGVRRAACPGSEARGSTQMPAAVAAAVAAVGGVAVEEGFDDHQTTGIAAPVATSTLPGGLSATSAEPLAREARLAAAGVAGACFEKVIGRA